MLKCWDSICTLKACGGLGFRRLYDFNKALISKLALSIASNKDIIWVQMLKCKYLRGKSFLFDDLSFNSASWAWNDIKNTRDLILKGASFYVTNSSDILIWKDYWIPTIPSFKPHISHLNPNPLGLNLIKDLIDNDSPSWNSHLLNISFAPDVVSEILKIQISHLASPKTLFGNPSKPGKFSSKSAYIVDQSNRFSFSTPPSGFNWNNLWNFKLHNRPNSSFGAFLTTSFPPNLD